MGCDIHMFCEVRNNEGKWIFQKDKFKNQYYNSERPINDWNTPFTSHPYNGRSYDLFSILADVRNGYGFAGIPTGAGFIPISEPKGMPDDASPEYLKEVEDYGEDGHSHTFLTIKEIQDFDWDQITIKRGTISLDQYKECRKTNTPPDSWSGAVSGGNTKTVSADFADTLIDNPSIAEIGIKFYVDYHWPIKYSDHAKYFLQTTMPTLKELGNPEDVRLVFFFDN